MINLDKQLTPREKALHKISELRKKYGERASKLSQANEAETRLLLVDSVLEILGWYKDDFNPERLAGRSGFTDYLLTVDKTPRIIVEAKRTTHTFSSPHKQHKRTNYTLKYFKSAYRQAFTEVLNQAERYAIETQVPFAILTNGGEWLLLQLLSVPGFNDIDDLQGVYFGNILSDDFDLFWELFCKSHVAIGSLEEYFGKVNVKEAEYSATPKAQFGDLQWQNVPEAEGINEFYDLFFDEMIDPGRRKMLEKCFVSSAILDHYSGELQRALRDAVPAYIRDAVELPPSEGDRLLPSETGDQKGRVVLVTGSVGSGKSTLVTKVLIKARQDKNLIAVIIDLIDEVAFDRNNVAVDLWTLIERQWSKIEEHSYTYDELKKIFKRELAILRKGASAKVFDLDELEYLRKEAELLEKLRSQPETFFSSCWRYYRSKRIGIVIFLDNVDRASERYQEQVYAFAHKIASETGVTVILTMREFTFFRGTRAGFLDVRANDTIFHLQSPDLRLVLSKRVQYIENDLNDDYRISQWKKRNDWSKFQNATLNHAKIVKNTFLTSKEGDELLAILAAVAWHDVRYFLRILGQIHSMLGSEGQPWKASEIVAALMISLTRNNISAVLSNIFRPPYSKYKCYYLKLRILLMLMYGQHQHETRSGTTLNKLVNYLKNYGYQSNWSKLAIQELVRERFLECLEAPVAEDYTKNYEIIDNHTFRPSPLAIVLIERIISEPVYLCLLGNDLPFHTKRIFDHYQGALNELFELLDDRQLERGAVEFLTETNLGRVVAKYLVGSIQDEPSPTNLLNHVPEMRPTENKVDQIVDILRKFADLPFQFPQRATLSGQLPLPFQTSEQAQSKEFFYIPIPGNIEQARIGKSEHAPLIFWALVNLKKNGYESVIGVEITKVINDYLLDDHNKKAPNNVSRALRSEFLQSLPWLITSSVSPRKKTFSLNDNWQLYWTEVFGEPAPVFE